MDETALARARDRISGTVSDETVSAELDLLLARSRRQIEEIPDQIAKALHESLNAEVLPVARHIAELRGLFNQANRRLERIEAELLAEREARLEDVALLVELVASSWRAVDARLARLEPSQDATPIEAQIERLPSAEPETAVDELVEEAAAA